MGEYVIVYACVCTCVHVYVCMCVCGYVCMSMCVYVMCAYGVGIGDEEWVKGGGEEGTVAGRAALGLMIPPQSSAIIQSTEYTPSAICMNRLEQWFS